VKRHDEQEFGEAMRRDGAAEGPSSVGAIEKSEAVAVKQSAVLEPAFAGGDFPAMPALLNIASLADYLEELGVTVHNQRPERGLMVYRTKAEFVALAEHLKRGGVDYWFHPKGR